jgi:hypothetical protein
MRVLSNFLDTDLISENLSLSRTVPADSIPLHIYGSGDEMNQLLICKCSVVIPSHPHDLLLFNFQYLFFIS